MILRCAAGLIGDDALDMVAADVSGDKTVNTADAVLVLQKKWRAWSTGFRPRHKPSISGKQKPAPIHGAGFRFV